MSVGNGDGVEPEEFLPSLLDPGQRRDHQLSSDIPG